jgi:hypothetical protein
MPSSNAWTMDHSTRNKLLKKYQTQVASGSSTICATLAVVSFIPEPFRLNSGFAFE